MTPQNRQDAVSVTSMSYASSGATARRHVLIAIGSGLTGLAATKALKLAQLNITDAAVFVGGVAVRCFTYVMRLASPWTPVVPAIITSSVLLLLAAIGIVDIVKLIAAAPNYAWAPSGHRRPHSAYAHLSGIRDLERKVG
jgi:hypothetical protein